MTPSRKRKEQSALALVQHHSRRSFVIYLYFHTPRFIAYLSSLPLFIVYLSILLPLKMSASVIVLTHMSTIVALFKLCSACAELEMVESFNDFSDSDCYRTTSFRPRLMLRSFPFTTLGLLSGFSIYLSTHLLEMCPLFPLLFSVKTYNLEL